MRRPILLMIVVLAALAAGTQSAAAAVFKATATGNQHLEWTVSGSDSGCEVRTATGSGATDFKFSTPKAAFLFVASSKKSAKVVGSINTVAKGAVSGSFSEATTTPCPGFAPAPPRTEDSSGCGPIKIGIRLDFNTEGAFVYVAGPKGFLAGEKSIVGDCPSPVGSSWQSSNDVTACGDSFTKQSRRSWGVSSAWGLGLFASKLTISKKLAKMKKGRSKTINGKTSVDCRVGSPFSGGVTFKGDLKYAVKFTRTG